MYRYIGSLAFYNGVQRSRMFCFLNSKLVEWLFLPCRVLKFTTDENHLPPTKFLPILNILVQVIFYFEVKNLNLSLDKYMCTHQKFSSSIYLRRNSESCKKKDIQHNVRSWFEVVDMQITAWWRLHFEPWGPQVLYSVSMFLPLGRFQTARKMLRSSTQW